MTELSLESVLERIKIKGYTAIICHQNPDPDTLGSAMGLRYILEKMGSKSKIVCGEKLPRRLAFMTDGEEILYEGDFSEFERLICVDVASPTQMGDLSVYMDKVDFTLDHHSMSTRFSDFYMENCAACAQIIYKIAEGLGIDDDLPIKFYESIYAGITGDTGCFKYSNVTDETHIIASKIVKKHIDYAEINRKIFDTKTVGEIAAQRITYQNMCLEANGKLAIITFTNKMKADNNLSEEDIGDVVNCVRQIDGVQVAVSIKQSPKDERKYNISSRSNCDVDVSKLCAHFGGGGHIRAAGCTIMADSKEEAENMIITVFSRELI